jgi:hypothetical protein
MRKTARLLRAFVISALVPIVVTAQADWKGAYAFYEDGGKNAGGVAILISHQLDVFDGADGLAASIESNGYQTSSELVCTAKIEGQKLLIYFQSYGENNMFEPYKQGDLLLTLERKAEKGKTVLITHWGKFTPSIPKNEKSGKVYFERSVDSGPKPR